MTEVEFTQTSPHEKRFGWRRSNWLDLSIQELLRNYTKVCEQYDHLWFKAKESGENPGSRADTRIVVLQELLPDGKIRQTLQTHLSIDAVRALEDGA